MTRLNKSPWRSTNFTISSIQSYMKRKRNALQVTWGPWWLQIPILQPYPVNNLIPTQIIQAETITIQRPFFNDVLSTIKDQTPWELYFAVATILQYQYHSKAYFQSHLKGLDWRSSLRITDAPSLGGVNSVFQSTIWYLCSSSNDPKISLYPCFLATGDEIVNKDIK